jgi:hypothetical protein
MRLKEREKGDDSEGWTTVSGKRWERSGPDVTPSPNARVSDMRERERKQGKNECTEEKRSDPGKGGRGSWMD